MSVAHKIRHEVVAIALTTAYFAAWFGMLLALKALLLAEYDVRFRSFSVALVGALVVAKVVLILDHVNLPGPLRRSPAFVEVAVRTLVYSAGALLLLVLEKAFEARHEFGGFVASLRRLSEHADLNQVWATAIAVGGALLGFNVLMLLRRHLGRRTLLGVLLAPPPAERSEGAPSPGATG